MSGSPELAEALDERNRIVAAFDIEAAKAWVIKHGGKVHAQANWERVLHIARMEINTLPERMRSDSHIWLARNGAIGLSTAPNHRDCLQALDLIFPKTMTDELIARSMGMGV